MTILVTGGTGFVGSHLCRRLVKEDFGDVICLSYSGDTSRINDIKKHLSVPTVDIRKEDCIDKICQENHIQTIVHVAGQVPYGYRPKDMVGVNDIGTYNIMRSAMRWGVKSVIYTSSLSVYSVPPKTLPVKENFDTKPIDNYGESKLQGEYWCHMVENDISVVILRLAGVFGVGCEPQRSMAVFTRNALTNQPIVITGHGDNSSEFIYVDDVVDAIVLAIRKGCGTYNVGCGEEMTIMELAKRIVQMTESKSRIILTNTMVERPFRFYLDISKAKRELGYNPKSFNDRLKQYVQAVSCG